MNVINCSVTHYILWIQCKKYLNYAGSKSDSLHKYILILVDILTITIQYYNFHIIIIPFLFSVFVNLFSCILSRWNPVLWFGLSYTDTSFHLQAFQVCEQECSISLKTSKYETVRAKYHMKRKSLVVRRKLKYTNDLLYGMYLLVHKGIWSHVFFDESFIQFSIKRFSSSCCNVCLSVFNNKS